MSIVTLTSDFGEGSHYTAILKGALWQRVPDVRIADISHSIRKFDVVEAAYLIRSVYREFPKGTIHLVCVQSAETPEAPHRLMQIHGHYFIGADTGVFRLIADREPDAVFDFSGLRLDVDAPTFPEREVFVPAAAHLARGGSPDVIGRLTGELRAGEPRRVAFEDKTLIGHVSFIDHFGNVITNIHRSVFKEFGKGRDFEIDMRTPRMGIREIHSGYQDVPAGERVAVFNHAGFLEIAINNHSAPGGRGGADTLLGLNRDHAIRVRFIDEDML